MAFELILWDLDDDPEGNVQRCAEHGVTKEEVEEVFENATDVDVSRSSGRPVAFGDTNTGRHLMVVYDEIDADTVYPVYRLRRSEEAPTMKRITRDRRLTPEEAAKYRAVREQVARELPELIARHHERTATLDQLNELLVQLKAAREAKGLSLADLTDLTGMDRSALSKLETGQRANPTVETLVRYAEAVGKRLVVSLTDA
jgi:uncharacterized DUF497 family protein/DNA-binding XRE family transcriptional regulator